ncbi:MAG: tetratricopeptide repeat protein [Litorimonas sp.]
MKNFSRCFFHPLLASAALCFVAPLSYAQTSTPPTTNIAASQTGDENLQAETIIEDEVIARGTIITGQHEGMDAFFRGDFVTAEIEFEQEFKGLRRFERARESAAEDAVLSADRAQAQADAGNNLSSSVNSRGGGAPAQSSSSALSANSGVTSNFINRRREGRTLLTDGKVTYEDFGFTRYMSGLSEIKLGKYEEAKVSLKQSLRYDESNYDARMRLGLLNIMDSDFESAADQLEKLDKQRRRCERIDCDDIQPLREATIELAKQITRAVEVQ